MDTRDQSGLSLLEVLVAALILGVLLVTVFKQFTVSLRLEADAQRHLEVLRLAESELERQKGELYGDLESFPNPQRHGDYWVSVDVVEHSVDNVDVVGNGKSKTVTVVVTYQEREREKSVSLTMERGEW